MEENFTLNTPASYDQENPELAPAYGLKRKCALNDLKYFHISWGSPSDLAHDLYEGFHIDLLQVTISHILRCKYISSSELNKIISSYPYIGHDLTNKPNQLIFESATRFRIKSTAAQSLCFVRLLPLMIGNHVPEEDERWIVFCKYLHCLDFILAPKLTTGDIAYMKSQIESLLKMFFTLHEDLPVKPKAHHLLHYATQYQHFGPLVDYVTLSYESKHQFMKSTIANNKNYKNTCLSMANRHQYNSVYHHLSSNYFDNDPKFLGHNIETQASIQPEFSQVLSEVLGPFTNVSLCKCVTFNGQTYDANYCVITAYNFDYEFAKIAKSLFFNGDIYFVLTKLDNKDYHPHLNAYILDETETNIVKRYDGLLSLLPIPLYEASNCSDGK